MSVERIHELAHEPEPPDEPEPVPTPDEPEGEPEPQDVAGEGETGDDPPPPPMGEREVDERYDKLARSATTWRNRISTVLGEDADELFACPLCETDIPGFIHPASIENPRDAMQERLFDAMQPPASPEYVDAPDVECCDACAGLGSVRTGSRVPQRETKTCGKCSGFGFFPPPGFAPPPATNGDAAPALAPAADGPLATDEFDLWGRPKFLPDGRKHPNYGMAPQYADPLYETPL